MMPSSLSFSRTNDLSMWLQQLAATQWWQQVPIDKVENILLRLKQSPSEPHGSRIGSLRMALEQSLLTVPLIPSAGAPHSESALELQSAVRDLVQSLSDVDIPLAFERMFGHPSTRLAVYGSLRPGESNHNQLATVPGNWQDGSVKGSIKRPGEYLEFTWDVCSSEVAVKVLTSDRLCDHFDRLDEFEGEDYRRILVPVMIAEKVQICHIYEGVRPFYHLGPISNDV